ncbi:retinol dehydrogenase 11 [Parathielavia hyrcaniae]|uniref:Retinol dehydrogenase 11 n=1 Tax=Parathielavia hyrcaniae TaxID=113614 RepID=A0AAN6PWB4_9PEZI|nr:retinol dehydrogenase 11 [Parathielavia hyrcaniae]
MSSNPQTDIPSLEGKVVLVTGGTAGLGARSVVQLAQRNPACIYFIGRNAKAADAVIQEATATTPASKTNIRFLPCDLASLASVKAAADTMLAEQSRLDVVLANAGIMNAPPSLTQDGYELQFGVNYLGHALLVRKLLPLLEQTAAAPGSDVRVVVLSSTGFVAHPGDGIQFNRLKTGQDFTLLGPLVRYGQSKLADVLLARELARRYPSILSVSVTPGIVATDLVNNLGAFHRGLAKLAALLRQGGLMTPDDGAKGLLWCVDASRGEIRAGEFYEPVGVHSKVATKRSGDMDLAKRLWEWTNVELEKWM